MMFKYKGIAKSGAPIRGVISASSYSEALKEIKNKGVLVTAINEAHGKAGLLDRTAPNFEDFEYITSELSLLLKNGVKIDKALKILEKAKAGTPTGKIVKSLSDKIAAGSSIAQAFSQYPEHFDKLYVNLINIAEETATLPEVFDGLAKDMHFKLQLKSKVKSALAYPMVIMAVCLLSILFIFNFVVPNLSTMFDSVSDLPLYTAIIIGLSDFFVQYQLLLLLFLLAFSGYIFVNRKHAKLQRVWQLILTKMPVISGFSLMSQRIKFCSSIVLMLRSGIKIEQAINLACNNVSNIALAKELRYSLQSIKRGDGIAYSLSSSSLFPDFYLSLIEVGEESASLDSVFDEIVQRSRSEFDAAIARTLTIFEPLLILIMGGIVGSVVITMMLSITTVTGMGI